MSIPQLAEKPIFVVGHPRSGTTLLRFVLSSHPRLYIPEETGFLPFLTSPAEIDVELSLARAREIVERIARLNHLWAGMVEDVPALYASLPQPTLTWLLDSLYRLQIAGSGAHRWGDKTPLYVQYIPLLSRIFPTAQFVHLIRDGRDAALSALDKWPERRRYMDIYYLMQHWVRNVNAGRLSGRELGPGRYTEIYYEELVRQPRVVIEQVCAFLGEEFRTEMLEQGRLARQVGPGPQDHTEVQQPISDASVHRWKEQMSPFDQKIADRVAGHTLSTLGYDRVRHGPFSPREWARFVVVATRYQLFNTTRRALYACGLLTLNRGMRR